MQYRQFQFDYFCSVAAYDITFCKNTSSMKQLDLYYFETIKMTSQALSKFTKNTRLRLVFSIENLTRFVMAFLWLQDSVDQVVSLNKC